VHILVFLVHILAVFSAYLHAYFTLLKCIAIRSLVITVLYFRLKIDILIVDLSSKAFFTRDILAHNIAIKRYYNKKTFLSHGFQ
jgi:hypothetical protein